jgi:hypothetical protein
MTSHNVIQIWRHTSLFIFFHTLLLRHVHINAVSRVFSVLNTQCPSQKQFYDTYGLAILIYVKCKMYSNLQRSFVVPIFVSVLAKISSLLFLKGWVESLVRKRNLFSQKFHPSQTFEILSSLFLFLNTKKFEF